MRCCCARGDAAGRGFRLVLGFGACAEERRKSTEAKNVHRLLCFCVRRATGAEGTWVSNHLGDEARYRLDRPVERGKRGRGVSLVVRVWGRGGNRRGKREEGSMQQHDTENASQSWTRLGGAFPLGAR